MTGRTDLAPLTTEDLVVIQAAEQRLIATCMGAQGFEYEGRDPESYTPAMPPYLRPAELRRGGYGYDWAGAAASFLRYNTDSGGRTESEEQLRAETEALYGPDDAERVTLTDPNGESMSFSTVGCYAEAREELYGSVRNALRYDRAVSVLSLSGIASTLRNMPGYAEPMARWQECMKTKGHDVGGESDYGGYWLAGVGAEALAENGMDQTQVTAELIQRVASDDADCQEESGLDAVRSELLPQAREHVAGELGLEMTQYIQFQHAVLERAKRVP